MKGGFGGGACNLRAGEVETGSLGLPGQLA